MKYVYDDAQEMAEVMNSCFQHVFTIEIDFHSQQSVDADEVGLGVIEVTVEEVRKLMEEQDVRKAIGPDGISNWILRKCSYQLADKIHAVIVSSLTEGKVPIDWKRADIVPIFKGGNKGTIKLQASLFNQCCGKNM